jgi:16S rRNA (guanine(966)-N(2))-methyltransferase RsmD
MRGSQTKTRAPVSGNIRGGRLRPTANKVREALFNILRGSASDKVFLDLYAGTGAIGIEALKEGALEVIFVEYSKSNTEKLSRLIKKLGFTEKTSIIKKKVLPFIKWAEINRLSADIIFVDPPYHSDELMRALTAISKTDILARNGIVIAEHFVKKQPEEKVNKLYKSKVYRYGDTVLSVYMTQEDIE